jgi:hypothetical protein
LAGYLPVEWAEEELRRVSGRQKVKTAPVDGRARGRKRVVGVPKEGRCVGEVAVGGVRSVSFPKKICACLASV